MIGPSPAAPAPSAQQLRWARPHQETALTQPSGRTPAIDVARLVARHPPAFLRRLHPETTRHRTREPRYHAAPSDRRITTRRRLAGGVRQPRDQRHPVRGAIHASARGAISARVPPSPPSRHTLHSARTTPNCTHQDARARRSTPRSTSSPISSSPGTPTHHPQVCPPALLAATHAARAAFGRPCRCARDRCTCCRCTRARTRRSLPLKPKLRARREARRPPRATHLAISTCERTRRLACFADGLHVAPPVAVQSAAAASGRARRPPRPRHIRHDKQVRRRHHGHEDLAAVTPTGSAAWPRRCEASACEACACEPGAVVLEGAAPSAHCSTRSPSSTPCQLRPGHRRHDRHCKHHRGLHAGAASRHGSTASPPPARRQPTLTRVALTCIDTAHTTHSRHRLPLAHTSHSHGMACHSHSPLPLTLTLTLPLAQSASTPTPS